MYTEEEFYIVWKRGFDEGRNRTKEELSLKRPWHPSDEAAIEKYLELAIKDWAHNFSRSELAIKYKIAKIIKAEGIKV
jgi:hypothetical protein